MNLTINKVGLSDLQKLRDIGIKSYLPHYAHLWKLHGIEWYMNRCFGEEFLKNEIVNPNVEYYIIENDGENIGMMKLVLKKTLPDSKIENSLFLEKIYFVEKWLGKGIGRKLIEFALRRAAELNRECVWLTAMDTSKKPIKAYEKAGFAINSYTNLGEEFALMKEEFRGMVVMKYCLEKIEN
ncbi:MAG: GNAT family N-acetyltransferase [Acidobacteriota bacterium]